MTSFSFYFKSSRDFTQLEHMGTSNYYQQTAELFHWIIKVKKEDSAFVYFILEANENLCFYSTLPHKNGEDYRKIEIYTPIEWEETLSLILHQLSLELPLLIESKTKLLDSSVSHTV